MNELLILQGIGHYPKSSLFEGYGPFIRSGR